MQKKHFIPTTEQISSANALIMSMAYLQTVTPVLKQMQQDVIDTFKFKWDFDKLGKFWKENHELFIKEHSEFCKKESNMYMVSDEDFNHYMQEYSKLFTEKGFTVKEFGYCPLLVADSLHIEARRLFIDAMEPITKLKFDDFFRTTDWKKNMDSCVDISLRLMGPYLKNLLKKAA